MKFRIPFQVLTSLGLLMAVVILMVIASFAWKTLSNVVQELSDAAQPQERLELAKGVAFAISDAENSVQTFVVAPDSANLEPYFSGVTTVQAKLDSLQITSSSEAEQSDVDSLSMIAGKKFDILFELLRLQKSAFIDSALQAISSKLEKQQEKYLAESNVQNSSGPGTATPSTEEGTQKEKTGLFKRMFTKKKTSKKNRKETKEDAPSPNTKPTIDYLTISRQLSEIRAEDRMQTQRLQGRELTLVRESQLLGIQMRGVLDEIEAKELVSRQEKSKITEENVSSANQVIVFFSIAATLLLGVIGFSILVFVRRNAEQKRLIEYAKEQAEQLAKDRERFVATMSHEIRTPMNAILGFSEQILQGKLEPEQRKHAEIVKDSSHHLLEIVNGVLDFTQLAAGKLKIAAVPYRLKDETNFIFELLKQPAQAKGIALKLTWSKDLPDIIQGDPLRYRQVLLNLLNNAIKFTEAGYVHLKINPGEGQTLRIEVEDTGIGIPKEKLGTIFGEYEQAETETSQKFGGTGLGLSITKMLLELQKGTISVQSQPGKGTTFFVTLPYQRATKKDLLSHQHRDGEHHDLPRGLRILVADDEAYNRVLLSRMLKTWDAEVLEASDGDEAFELFGKHDFDLLLLDIKMPGKSGIELAKAISEEEKSKKQKTPMIALTGGITQSEMDACKKVGMHSVLVKPTSMSELASAIVSTGAKAQAPSGSKRGIGDMKQLLKLAHGNVEFVDDLVQTYLNTLLQSLPEISAACKQKNWAQVSEICHKLAPPTRHVEAMHFHYMLKTLESAAKDGADETRILNLAAQVDQEGKEVLNEVRSAWDKFKSKQ